MVNLWPDLIPKNPQLSPLEILRQQASFLGDKTQNVVTAVVNVSQNSTNKGFFQYVFYIVAPILSNYHYRLFTLYQRIEFYPINVVLDEDVLIELKTVNNGGIGYFFAQETLPSDESHVFVKGLTSTVLICQNEQDFLDALRDIFATQRVVKIIQSLYSQSMSMKGG